MALSIGEEALDFDLPGVDGKNHSLAEFQDKPVLVVAFWCNHCPSVQAWERRVIEVQRDYADRGVQIVAINSNETVNYPTDDFPHMVRRAKDKGYNFPYLRDESQAIARAYGPTRTPELFVFDGQRRLRYHGAPDDNRDVPTQVTRKYIREALDAVLSEREPETPLTPPVGCSIKWAA